MKGLEEEILKHCDTGADATLILSNLSARLGRAFPDHSEGLSGAALSHNAQAPCRCSVLFPALQELRANPVVNQKADVLEA